MSAGGGSDETRPREFEAMIPIYHPEASEELIEAADFYEQRESGLGYRFLDALEDSIARLKVESCLAPSDEQGRRKYLIHGFPYVVIYRIKGTVLYVLAVAHTSRKPDYWMSRDPGLPG